MGYLIDLIDVMMDGHLSNSRPSLVFVLDMKIQSSLSWCLDLTVCDQVPLQSCLLIS